MANKYIKTKSKYILSKLHQDSNKGKIYERDWVTIGGVDPFATTQTPIYKSDNFIITVGNDSKSSKVFNSEEWETINGETNWTLDEINKNTDDEENTDGNYDNNKVKIDYYSLKDFAYFGSCSELIRASINNILANFPGELYAHVYKIRNKTVFPTVYYDDKSKGITQDKIVTKELGDGKLLLENPFNINLHDKSNSSDSITNFVKRYADYQIISGSSAYNITNISITRNTTEENKICTGYLIYTIAINYNNSVLNVYAYQGEDKMYYFVDKSHEQIHIRPKNKFYNQFLGSLDIFEKILLNPSTNPKYKASFEIISENDYGLKTEIKDFIFPIGNGGYNIGSNKAALEKYIQSLIDVASYYDNVFCDNLYRSLTHESIKNFDWTYRKLNTDETETYQEGLDKITKILRIFGRAFDDLKLNIDNIKNINNVTYDDVNNTSDDMLSSLCDMDGWDIIHIAPYKISSQSQVGDSEMPKKYIFSRDYTSKYKPYEISNYYGYFSPCGSETEEINTGNLPYKIDPNTKKILYPIKVYSSDREYNINEIFIHFLKILKLNSRHIWKCKGTINSVKEILSLFGLKYNRDFTIKEYTLLSNTLADSYRDDVNDYNINYINKTKTIQYTNDDFLNGENVDYIGLPVIYREINNNRYLYPYFNQYDSYDGNLYYQMKGGWMRKKPFIFTTDDYMLSTSDVDLYSETLNSLSIVNNIEELITLPKASLHNDDIYYVTNLSGKYVIVDGNLYEIQTDNKGDYISVYVQSNSLQVGNTLFVGNVTVSNGEKEKKYDLNYLPNNYEIRIYVITVNGNKTITVKSDDMTISSPFIYENGALNGMYKPTHYFRLNNVEESGTIGTYGWEQLGENNPTYLKIKLVKNYFKGNNPHYGHMAYDNGFDYILHFKQLFKYACDNYLFDERYYNGDINQAITQASDIGFSGLLKTDDLCNFNIENNTNLLEDTKIHFFKPRLETVEAQTNDKNYYANSKNSISVINEYPTLDYVCHDSSCTKNAQGYINPWQGFNITCTGNTYISNTINTYELDTYRIMNTKWVDIIFYFEPDIQSEASIELFKYFDSVVTQYLSQVLPSTAICTIKYENKK